MTTRQAAQASWDHYRRSIPPEVRPPMSEDYYAGFRAGKNHEKELAIEELRRSLKKYQEGE